MAVHCHAGRSEYQSLRTRWQYIVMLVEVSISLRARWQYIVMLVEVSISLSGQGGSTLSCW